MGMWLVGLYEFECSSERLPEVALQAFESWVRGDPRRPVVRAAPLEFEEPPANGHMSAKDRHQQIRIEQSAGTLLFKTGVRWDAVFDETTVAPQGQKLPSASLIVSRRGPTHLFSGGKGALYSGIFSTVYASSGGDMQSGDFSLDRWRDIIAGRSRLRGKGLHTIAINLALLSEAQQGGLHSHNEVLAVLRPSSLLGMFFVSTATKDRRGVGGMLSTVEDQLAYEELVGVQQTYPLARDLPILQFDAERTSFL